MTVASRIDVSGSKKSQGADVVLGDDWIAPHTSADSEVRARRARRSLISINRSPLARKIVTFNLLALIILVAGVLYLNPFRDSLVVQRERGLVVEAQLIANVLGTQIGETAGHGQGDNGAQADGGAEAGAQADPGKIIADIALRNGVQVYVFDADHRLLAANRSTAGTATEGVIGLPDEHRSTFMTGFLNAVWNGISSLLSPTDKPPPRFDPLNQARQIIPDALSGKTRVDTTVDENGSTVFSVSTPILKDGRPVGAVALLSAAGELDRLVRAEREQILQMFVIAILVSVGLSLVLASTVANPLSDLAAAAEVGQQKNTGRMSPGRVRIPDLSGRPDEIGRLSSALRGMVTALYERIDANEQFAADVAHEIKNPLASLRSAVGTLRVAKREDQRRQLLDVIEHDVRRLDRLVSDISNASRLDSELVKEEEEPFDLLKMLRNITDYLGNEARSKGIEFITDLPADPIETQGLEARLAQVFVNLISNAISFCEAGDAIRIWARKRENRVLVVVEDTGPGIPE